MTVTLNTDTGSVVAQPGQQIDVASLLTITAGSDPTYLVVSLLDRNEYTAASNGNTGTLSGNGDTIGFSNLSGDSDTVGIVFTYNASTGQYTNATYGNFANLIYAASTNPNDNTSISFFTTNDATIANQYANNPYTLEQYVPASTTYVGSTSVVTQPSFAGPTPTQATPNSIEAAAMSFVGEAWNLDGCWVLASNIAAEVGASLPITSTSLGIPGVASGEWIVVYNGPAGQTGNWESMITAGEMVVFETSGNSGHITTVVSGSGSSAMLVDNITYVNQYGQITNPANDGSPNDIIIAAPHAASQEWAQAVAGSVVVYELDCPIITVTTAVSTVAAGTTVALAALFSASNPLASQAVTEYQFYDVGTGGAASDSFMVGNADEVSHSAASAITVNASALSTVDLLGGTSAGTDTVEVRAFNGSYWGDWVPMTADITGAVSPTVNVSSFTVAAHQSIAASSFFTISNPNGDSITEYSFEDNGGGSGHFNLSGTTEPNGQAFTISAANLSSVQYVGGSSAGTDTLMIDAYDATTSTWMSSVSLSAVTTAAFPLASANDVTEALYIGYFGRAGDPMGDSYWLNQLSGGTSETSVAASFSVQPEAQALYPFLAAASTPSQPQEPFLQGPSTMSEAQITSFIDSVYANLFNRAPDSGGLTYWVDYLAANLQNPQAVGAFILDVISGAEGPDQTTIANKVTVADYFTQELASADVTFTSSADTLAHTAIASVTSASSTVLAAESTINSWLTTQSSGAEIALVGTYPTNAASILGHI